MLCSSGTGEFKVAYGLASPLNQPVPHTSSTAHTMIHGSSASQTSPVLGGSARVLGGGGMLSAESSWLRKAGDVQILTGCQTLRNRTRQAIDISDAPISTIH